MSGDGAGNQHTQADHEEADPSRPQRFAPPPSREVDGEAVERERDERKDDCELSQQVDHALHEAQLVRMDENDLRRLRGELAGEVDPCS